jgi:hypothetical protein
VGSWRKLECGRIGEEWSSEEEGEKRRGDLWLRTYQKNRVT